MAIRQFLQPGVTASAIVHLSMVAVILIYTEVRPFRAVSERAVPVDVIVADEPKKVEPPLSLPSPSAAASPPATSTQAPAAPAAPAPSAAPASPPADSNRPPPANRPNPAPTQLASAATRLSQPEPDVTIKYHVMLGLPEVSSPLPASSEKTGEGGDTTPATNNLSANLVEPLRQHLKTCSKLSAALSRSDNVAVKLRVQLTPDGRLAGEPALLEGSASMKGVELMRAAIRALSACQPYAMLPASRYGEWKVLDLSFTPSDFAS